MICDDIWWYMMIYDDTRIWWYTMIFDDVGIILPVKFADELGVIRWWQRPTFWAGHDWPQSLALAGFSYVFHTRSSCDFLPTTDLVRRTGSHWYSNCAIFPHATIFFYHHSCWDLSTFSEFSGPTTQMTPAKFNHFHPLKMDQNGWCLMVSSSRNHQLDPTGGLTESCSCLTNANCWWLSSWDFLSAPDMWGANLRSTSYAMTLSYYCLSTWRI